MVKNELTDEQKIKKFDEHKVKHYGFTKNWIANNKERHLKSQHEYYLRNKEEHNRKCAIYQKKKYDAKKAEKIALQLLESEKKEAGGVSLGIVVDVPPLPEN
jgi:hypothetical protein